MFPRFSPDGKNLAFTAQYDGNTEVYVMPSDGGTPRRLTYTATLERDDVSDHIGPEQHRDDLARQRDRHLPLQNSSSRTLKGHLTLASLKGGIPETLPLPRGG